DAQDGDGALRMVRDIEQRAVRGQSTATRLGAHRDLPHLPAEYEVNYRNGAGDRVGDVCGSISRVDRNAAGLLTDPNLTPLGGDVHAIRVFHFDDGHTVCFTVNDHEAPFIRGESYSRRAARWVSKVRVLSSLLLYGGVSDRGRAAR